MSNEPNRRPALTEDLADIFRDTADEDDRVLDVTQPAATRHRTKNRPTRRWPAWLTFAGGLLIGWLVIGWWIWPVHWTNSDPWDMSSLHQETYLQLIADRYWTTRDLAQAEDALGGWNRDDVNQRLVAMQSEIVGVEARQRLAALSDALRLPGGEQSLLESIFGQEGILVALGLAALPMLLAIGIVVLSKFRPANTSEDELGPGSDGEASLEELLSDVELEALGGGESPDQQSQTEAAPGQESPTEEQSPQEEDEEEDPNSGNPLGDLASLFEEEDTSLVTLEAMSKGLPDYGVEDMLKAAREILHRFKEEQPKT